MKLMKKDRKTNFKFAQIVILILLFFGTMNVRNLYFYFLFGAAVIGILMNGRFLRVNGMVAVLLLLSLCYLLFYPNASSSMTTALKQFLFPMCYLMGLNFIRKEDSGLRSDRAEQQMTAAIVVCAMGAFGHYLLNMSINFGSLLRNNVDIWTGGIVSATGQAGLAIFALGVFSAWMFDGKKRKPIAALGLILILAYNLVLAGRTLILLTIIVLSVAFFYAVKTTQAKRKGRLFLALSFALLVIMVIYMQNWFGIRDWVLGSNLSSRFDMMDMGQDTRTDNKRMYFAYMLDYPFGGDALHNEVGGYAHELYLDVYSDAGFLAYLLVVLFAADSFLTAFRIVRKGKTSNDFKLLVLCVFVAIFIEFFLEPIIQGMPWMFCTFCFFSGLLKNVQTTGRGGGVRMEDTE